MRYTVLWLLTKSVQSNIGHYLCGFNRQHQLEPIDSYFTLTGKSCRVNNCLQSILTFFDDLSPTKIDFYQKSLPLCYEVIYLLCTNNSPNIIKITFDILHEHIFIQKQIQLYFPLKTSSTNIFKYSIETYLLRLIAYELFHLTNQPTIISKNLIDTTITLLFELIDIKLNRLTLSLLNSPLDKQEHLLLNQLKTPNIDLNKINHILQACQYNERANLKLYRLDSLKTFLSNEIKSIQQTNNNNNNELINEINNNQENYINDCKIILAYANQLNNEQIDIYWRNSHIDAWRSLIELILYFNLIQIKTFPFDLCNFLYEKILNQTNLVLDDQQSSHLMNVFLTSIISIKQLKLTGEYRTNLIVILKNLFDFIQQRFTPKGRAAIYGAIVQCIDIIENAEQQQQDDLRRIFNNAMQHNHNLLTIVYDDALSNVPAVRVSLQQIDTTQRQ
jgi:hypothetical protein